MSFARACNIDEGGEQFDIVTLQEDDPSIFFWKHHVIKGVRRNKKLLQSESDSIFHWNCSNLIREDKSFAACHACINYPSRVEEPPQ